jgi:excisionase family DNA binding protein
VFGGDLMKHITNYKPKEFAELLNVSVKTLQRWDRDKILIAKRTPTDRRFYTEEQLQEYLKKSDKNVKSL